MPTRKPIPSGGDSPTTTPTKDGQDSSSPIQSDHDYNQWCACFQAAIIGVAGAQRATPNPELIVSYAVRIADRAFQECQRRRAKATDA